MDAREGYIRAEDRTEQAPAGKRWRSSFEWELVEPELLRELIAALPDGRAAVADIDEPALLLEVARRVFGTQLPKRATEFEYLETLWPEAVTRNTDLDALLHEWSADPADY